MQRRICRVCTFAQAHLSLRPGTEISCAGSNNDLCTVYKSSECCGEAAPATTGILCNRQCVVSMRQKMLPVRCNKYSSIKDLLVYQEKKPKVVIVFWMLFHGNMTTAALRRADFTQFWQLHWKEAPVTAKIQNFVGFAVQTMNYITNCLAEP